jgi:hypothetical protein
LESGKYASDVDDEDDDMPIIADDSMGGGLGLNQETRNLLLRKGNIAQNKGQWVEVKEEKKKMESNSSNSDSDSSSSDDE